jgi:Cu/Ag efflux pump CusA
MLGSELMQRIAVPMVGGMVYFCRCTRYEHIVRAIRTVVAEWGARKGCARGHPEERADFYD